MPGCDRWCPESSSLWCRRLACTGAAETPTPQTRTLRCDRQDMHPPVVDFKATRGKQSDRFGIRLAFGSEDPRGERLWRVVVTDRNARLNDDRALVVVVVG